MDDMVLLRDYAADSSETAFAELVSRRIGFVYAAALRQVRDPHLAEEITQAVFIILAQKAGRISDKTILTGWLFRTTRFAALAQIRERAKRWRRELEVQMQSEFQTPAADEVWNQMSPVLDEALATLGEKDRQAVLLRFFENKSLAEVGSFLGMGEDTARKRVSRALEKLSRYFAKRDVSSTAETLAGAISANSAHAAPIGLAATITATVIKGPAVAASTLALVKGTIKLMTWTQLKFALGTASAILLAGGAMTVALSQGGSPPLTINSIPIQQGPSILVDARFFVVPDESLKTLDIPWQTKSGTTTALLTATQVNDILRRITNAPGAVLLGRPRVETDSGTQAEMSMTKPVTLAGTNAQAGTTLEVVPSVSGNMFDLKLAAEWSEVPAASQQLLTTRAKTAVQLAKGQTVVLRQEIEQVAMQAADTPSRSLVVFVTPSLPATRLKMLGPVNGQRVVRTFQDGNAVTQTNNYTIPQQR